MPAEQRLGALDATGKFCGSGANFDKIKAELSQFLLSWNSVNPAATRCSGSTIGRGLSGAIQIHRFTTARSPTTTDSFD